MKHIRKFENYQKNKRREEIIKESVLQVNDIYKVRTMIDIPQSMINAYVKKVKDTTGKNLRQFFGDVDIAEEVVKYVTQNFLNVDQIPGGALTGDAQGQVQGQEGQPQVQVDAQQAQPQAQMQEEPQMQAQPQMQEEPQAQPQMQAQPQGQGQMQAQPQSQGQMQTQAQTQTQGEFEEIEEPQSQSEEEEGEEELPI